MMRRTILAAFLCLGAVAGAQAGEVDGPHLTVTGEGRVDSAPDLATITLGVTNQAESAGAAMAATSDAVTAILARLASDGIEARDVQTRDLSLRPVRPSRSGAPTVEPEVSGFRATNTVVVRVRDLDALGGILDRVIQSGANTFQGLQFGLQDPAPLIERAQRAAVADARRKAALFAEAAGVRLGPLLRLDEGAGGPSGPMPVARMEMASAPVPVAGGEVTTSASVTMIFAISEPD